jgi:hypothetical protein
MLTADEPRTREPIAETELLVEEARQEQRRRRRKRAVLFFAAVVLLGLALTVAAVTRGGSGVKAAQPPAAAAAADSGNVVIYEKFELIWARPAPGRPTVRAVISSWTDPALGSWRETVRGRPGLEYGSSYVRDPATGPENATYLYDRHTRALYRTGAVAAGAQPGWGKPTLEALRRQLAGMGLHLAGTRLYEGHTVIAFTATYSSPAHTEHSSIYFDAQSYVPVLWKESGGPGHLLVRGLAWKVLPATKANLRLANITTTHPGTRIVPERVTHIAGSVYNTEPQHIPGVPAAFESAPFDPPSAHIGY